MSEIAAVAFVGAAVLLMEDLKQIYNMVELVVTPSECHTGYVGDRHTPSMCGFLDILQLSNLYSSVMELCRFLIKRKKK